MGTSYRLAFDAANVHYPLWRQTLPWLAGAAAGVALVRWPGLYGDAKRRFTRAVGVLLCIAGCGIALVLSTVNAQQRQRVVSALIERRCQILEGPVQHFRPGAADSHPPEEFDVAGQHFHYAPADQLYGFNQVVGAGGPVREGLQVRLCHIDGLIARLEIAQ